MCIESASKMLKGFFGFFDAERRKDAARTRLAAATQGGDPCALKAAVREGRDAGLMDAELSEAEGALKLASERRRLAAREGLTAAIESRDVTSLQAAIQEGCGR